MTRPLRINTTTQRYRARILGSYLQKLVATAIKKTGSSQNELARSAGIKKWDLSKYINGVAHPDPGNRGRLVEHFGADEQRLLNAELADKILLLIESQGRTVEDGSKAMRLIRRSAK